MILIEHHDARYLAVHAEYRHKDAIKLLADYPDVCWSPEARCWLVDNRLWDELVLALGPWIAPLPVEFWMTFTPYEPPPTTPRRRSTREIMAEKQVEHAAAAKWGQAIVEMGKA